jgi:hypothetical protein
MNFSNGFYLLCHPPHALTVSTDHSAARECGADIAFSEFLVKQGSEIAPSSKSQRSNGSGHAQHRLSFHVVFRLQKATAKLLNDAFYAM